MLAFFARLALPRWVIELLGILAIGAALAFTLMSWDAHCRAQGVAQEKARRDLIDAATDARAKADLARLNAQVVAAKGLLAQAQARVDELLQEMNHVQTANSALQSDLAAGRQRLRVALARPGTPAAPGSAGDPAAGRLDQESAATDELDPAAAARTAGLTGEGDSAIIRLNACIVAYDAARAAVEEAGKP